MLVMSIQGNFSLSLVADNSFILAPKVLHKLQKKQNGVYFCSDISLKKSSRLEIMICN